MKSLDKNKSKSSEGKGVKPLRIQNALKLYLKITGLSHRKLAEDLGVNHTTLSRYIKGEQCRQRIDIKVFRWLLEEDNITDLTYIH